MKKILILALAFFGCAQKENPIEHTDNWETPKLLFKRNAENNSQGVLVTAQFEIGSIVGEDKFEFVFSGDNALKQKSIVNVKVQANCAEDANLKVNSYTEDFDLGAAPIFSASELLPPTAIFENTKKLFCQWTITIFNVTGSTQRFPLAVTQLSVEKSEPKIRIVSRDQKDGSVGSIDPSNIKDLYYMVRDIGTLQANLKCDLISIAAATHGTYLYDILMQASDNEELRAQNPTQRCLLEVKNESGRISRSAAFIAYLYPEMQHSVEIELAPALEELPAPDNIFFMVRATFKNLSNVTKMFSLATHSTSYDILFFDDQGVGTMLANASHFKFERKDDGQLRMIENPDYKISVVDGKQVVEVKPHQSVRVPINFTFTISASCPRSGVNTAGGFRIPLPSDFLGQFSPYIDKKGREIDLRQAHGTKFINKPFDYFIKLMHGKLLPPANLQRGFIEQVPKFGC